MSVTSISKILFAGLGVAVFGFLAPKLWDLATFRSLSDETVTLYATYGDHGIDIFVRNDSDQPLDLVRLDLTIAGLTTEETTLGAHPEATGLYKVTLDDTVKTLRSENGEIRLRSPVLQVIEPAQTDRFLLEVEGAAGPVDLSGVDMTGAALDTGGRRYEIRFRD